MTSKGPHKKAARFDFEGPRNASVIICRQVVDGAPVLQAGRDGDGGWQFLCDGDHSDDGPDGPVVACLECVVADDPSLNELADMCLNESARRADPTSPWERQDDLEHIIRETVERVGWFVLKVEAGASEDEPAFAYTIGLHKSYGHPELIIIGQPPEVMHSLLNVCGTRIKAGEKLPLGQRMSGVLDDYDVLFREITSRETFKDHVGYALWFHEGHTFRLLQLVWPDKNGRFPGDPDLNPHVTKRQPLPP